MSSLVSLVVTLRPLARTTVPAHLGPACQAWFLGLVAAVDSTLARHLHAGNGRRAYTVSPLQDAGTPRQGRVELTPERTVWVRFTSLSTPLGTLLAEEDGLQLPPTVTLGGAELRVEMKSTNGAAHLWAGQSSYETLLERYVLSGAHPGRRLALRFASPTAFRRTGGTFEAKRVHDHDVCVPLPDLVFGSLADAWEAFGPVKLSRDVRSFATQCLAMERFSLRTCLVDDGRGRHPGLLGSCHYQALVDDALWLRLVHLLAAYSFFCGTGRATAAGWGQTMPA